MNYTGAAMNIHMEKELLDACQNGNLETVERILGRTRGHYPRALEQAVDYGRHHIVKYLLEQGSSPSVTMLTSACSRKDEKVLKLLLKHSGKYCLTPDVLDSAAFAGDPQIFEILIDHNCPVTARSMENAIEGGNADLLKKLLELKVSGLKIKPTAQVFAKALLFNDLTSIHLLTTCSTSKVEEWASGIMAARKKKSIDSSLLSIRPFLTSYEFEKVQARIKFILPTVEFFLNEEEEAA